MQSLSDGRGKIAKPKTDASPTHSSNVFPSPVSLSADGARSMKLRGYVVHIAADKERGNTAVGVVFTD